MKWKLDSMELNWKQKLKHEVLVFVLLARCTCCWLSLLSIPELSLLTKFLITPLLVQQAFTVHSISVLANTGLKYSKRSNLYGNEDVEPRLSPLTWIPIGVN